MTVTQYALVNYEKKTHSLMCNIPKTFELSVFDFGQKPYRNFKPYHSPSMFLHSLLLLL